MKIEENGVIQKLHTYAYGNENRLLKITDQAGELVSQFGCDAAGNRISKLTPEGATYYNYDDRNLLISVITPTQLVTYRYNGAGHRIDKTANGLRRRFIIDLNQSIEEVVQERDSDDNTLVSYSYGLERLFFAEGSAVQFYLSDRLGSVRQVTDGVGSVLQTRHYDIFGATAN